MSAIADSRGEADARPPEAVFVVGPGGSGGPALTRALASLRMSTALAEEPAPLASLGRDGDRREGTGSPAGARRVRTRASGLTAIEGAPRRALQIPHLAETFPDARFVLCWRQPEEAMARAYEVWRSGRAVTHPDLDGWRGPDWSLALIPGWQRLSGEDLGTIVAEQWSVVVDVMVEDLDGLGPGRRLLTTHAALRADGAELARLCSRLELDPGGVERAARTLAADLEAEEPPGELPADLRAALPRTAEVARRATEWIGRAGWADSSEPEPDRPR